MPRAKPAPSAPPPRWELYRLLGDPARLRILALVSEEELSIGELATLLVEAQPKVSRHVSPLRRAQVVHVRRAGTRALVTLADDALDTDPFLRDAVREGRRLIQEDGSIGRIAQVVSQRELPSRAFFDQSTDQDTEHGPMPLPPAMLAHLSALRSLLPMRHRLAVDVGTGDGGVLDVLAPLFDRVLACDRSSQQLALAQKRIRSRGYAHVRLHESEASDPAFVQRCEELGGADLVVASRVMHHASRPASFLRGLVPLLHDQGTLMIIDYKLHEDTRMQEERADLWPGFSEGELKALFLEAGLQHVRVQPLFPVGAGRTPDAHLNWQAAVGRLANDA